MIASPLPQVLGTGILHLGLGAFHRAHQAAYTQDAIAAEGGDWGIEAVAMRNPVLAEVLTKQGGRFTLIERHSEGPKLLDMTVIRKAWVLQGNAVLLSDRMADPTIHIVTITVTEKGYGADIGARKLDRADLAIAHDLSQPDAPRQSLIGHLVAGLAARKDAGLGGLTLMSCDNLPENGALLSALVLEFAQHVGPDLAKWIEQKCRFPSSMVDRITPAASDETFSIAENALGRPDRAAIETEPFRQWVIEDCFAGPRPAWEAAGAQIVADVAPFEAMKLRLLNGAHSLIAYLGALAGKQAVRDVMADADLRSVVRAHMALAAQTLAHGPALDPDSYADALIERFANPAIDHRCLQIAMDGSQKLPQRIFTPARLQLDNARRIGTFALATAAWIRFAEKSQTQGQLPPLIDPMADDIRAAFATTGTDPDARVAALAGLTGLAHEGLLTHADFSHCVAKLLMQLERDGVVAAARAAMDV